MWRVIRSMRVLLALGLLFEVSCTRMPTAPPAEITVTGQITGPDGRPIHALLAFNPLDPGMPHARATARADSSGTYSLRLATGTYAVVIHPGSQGLLDHVERVAFTRSSPRFDHWFSGHLLTGTVYDPDGDVVDSGRVVVQILTPTPYSIGASNLTHGRYSFVLSTGTYALHAESGDYWSGLARTTSSPVTVQSDTTIDIDMGGIQITGTVLGPSGVPMEKVAVDAYGGDYVAHHLTGADGRYRLWLHPRAYRFRVWPLDSFHIAGRLTDPVQVQNPTTLDFDLKGVEWTGTIRWLDSGGPVPDVFVTVFELERDLLAGARTDSDGNFRLVVDPGQTYDLVAHSEAIDEIVIDSLTARSDTTFAILAEPAAHP